MKVIWRIASVIVITGCIFLAWRNFYNIYRLRAAVDTLPSSPVVEYVVDDTWHTDEPPEGAAIVGLWYDGDTVSSLVAIRVLGAYYPANPGRQAPVETLPPAVWAYLP